MNLKLQRVFYEDDGIISNCFDENRQLLMVTLEHAYPSGLPNYKWLPKLMPGKYVCVRGMHRLRSMTKDFETFEVTGVPGHTGILFHHGNWNEDSEGCILTGDNLDAAKRNGKDQDLVVNTFPAFNRFMAAQKNVDRFMLEVLA